jgi:hypothetical protein
LAGEKGMAQRLTATFAPSPFVKDYILCNKMTVRSSAGYYLRTWTAANAGVLIKILQAELLCFFFGFD